MEQTQHGTVVVTGGSRGIGAACAARLARDGWRVAVCYRESETAARALAASLPCAQAFFADVRSEDSVTRLFAAVQAQLGEADALVNCAGVAQQKLFTDLTAAEWDEMFAVHVRGAFLCTRAALPHMIHAKRGRIVNVASMWGQTGASCEVHYSAAKAALIGMTKALAKEEGPSGITVNCVAPGAVETDMMAAFSAQDKAALAEETPLCRLGTPADIAGAVAFLLSDEASFITGQVLSVNGGFVI